MLCRTHLLITLCLFFTITLFSQETLPNFTVAKRGADRVIISWVNPYGKGIRQLSIQRSSDSLKNFKTIVTIPDPTVPQNGYVDSKSSNDIAFYRLYILLDSGTYVFSNSAQPIAFAAPEVSKDTFTVVIEKNDPPAANNKYHGDLSLTPKPKTIVEKIVIPDRMIYVKKRDTLMGQISEKMVKKFRDSVNLKTKDTFSFKTPDTIVIKTYIPREVYKPSRFVYTEKDGNVRIALPDALTKNYSIKFFDNNNQPVFEIKKVREPMLILEKTNFMQAGWYKFELYQDGVLKEKNKFNIPKDF